MTSAPSIPVLSEKPHAQPRVRAGLSAALIVLGLGAVAFALAFNGAALELALRGRADDSLAWGPSLFRALLAFHGLVLLLTGVAVRRVTVQARSASTVSSLGADRSTPGAWLLLGVLLILAAALRLWQLHTGLWLDEILMLADFVRPPKQGGAF